MKERSTGVHRSTFYLPLIRNYADALLRFQKTKPIRGRAEDKVRYGITSSPTPTIPLGRREDVDTYSMRKLEDGSIQLINYRNPCVTFTPDNLIHITPKYGCLMESGMIERVLGVKAWLDRKKIGLVLPDEDGDRHVIEAGMTLTLKSEGERLELHQKDTVFSYYVNRKASNNVRAQYSEFSKYLHGFLQLRKDTEKYDRYNRLKGSHVEATQEFVRIQLSEIADCVGYERGQENKWVRGAIVGKEQVWKPDLRDFKMIADKPQGYRCLNTYALGNGDMPETHWVRYQNQTKNFLALVANGQPDDIRTDNFYRATLTLLGLSLGYIHRTPLEGEDASFTVLLSTVQNLWDTVLLKFYSDTMLDKRELKPNQLPNDKYNNYVTIMPTQEEIDRHKERYPNMSDVNFNIS